VGHQLRYYVNGRVAEMMAVHESLTVTSGSEGMKESGRACTLPCIRILGDVGGCLIRYKMSRFPHAHVASPKSNIWVNLTCYPRLLQDFRVHACSRRPLICASPHA